MALTSGAVSLTSRSATSIVLAGAVATGGSGTYTYQWYRSTGTDYGNWTSLSGKTSAASCSDTTVSAGQMYSYILVSTDTGVSPNVQTASATLGAYLAFSQGSSGVNQTYTAAATAFTPVATPTDFANIFGSTTRNVIITRVEVSGMTSAATAITMDLQLIKRSTAGTLGSAVLTGLTEVPVDSASPAATATASTVGTANYGTLGTLVGVVEVKKLPLTLSPATATDFPIANPVVFTFNDLAEQGIVLRGASDQLALGLNGAALPAGTSLNIIFTWIEI